MSGLNNYQKYIIEAAYKNAVKNKPNTSSMLAWYEEEGDLKKRIDISNIWLDSEKIPLEAPKLDNGETYTVKTKKIEIDVLKYYEDTPLYSVQGTRATFQNSLLIDSIESSYGTGYAVILTDSSGNEVPFGLNKWVVDPGTGFLTFIDGLPTGYASPFYVSFYRYVGRKGNTGILTTDGTQTMLPGYEPTEDKSLVTKDYVDTNVTDVNSIVKKLIPNTPDTFNGKDLILLNKSRKGQLVTSTDDPIDVVYVDDKIIKVQVPEFWDEDNKGFFVIYINDNEFYKVTIQNLKDGNYSEEYIQVNSIVESYPDNVVADDFYKSINLTLSLNYQNHISPYIANPKYPIARIKVKWYSNANRDGYYSNDLVIGLDDYSEVGLIPSTIINRTKISQKYISGVPAMIKGDSFYIANTINTLKKFKKDVHGHVLIKDLFENDIYTNLTYPDFGLPIDDSQKVEVPENIYQETMTVTVKSLNLDDEVNAEKTYTWNIRTDSVSDESNRVTSPDLDGLNFGQEWDDTNQKKSLRTTNELQMLNGKYQWPRGNYQTNGQDLPFLDAWGAGPNYDTLPTVGTRYVTFKYKLDNVNGFYFKLDNAEGIEYNPNDFTFTNITSIRCIIDGKYEWLDMNSPFDGVLSPFDFEDKGCLVINRSNAEKRYCTFGTEVLSGNMYIVFGIPYNLNIKLSGISVFFEK